jgi:hypothetical protein
MLRTCSFTCCLTGIKYLPGILFRDVMAATQVCDDAGAWYKGIMTVETVLRTVS